MNTLARDRSSLTWTLRTLYISVRMRLERFPLSVLQLAMRIGVGAVFFNSGLLKIRSWEFAIKLFEDEYRVPLLDPVVAAKFSAFTELTFPVLLFAGFATRLATLPLLGMIVVIQTFVYPQAWAEHLFWASVLVFLLTRGPGAFSLDHLIEHRFSIYSPHRLSKEFAKD